MLESAIQSRIIRKLKEAGFLPVKAVLTSLSGFPDIIVFGSHSACFFIEVKQLGKKPTKLQEHVHALLRQRGFDVYVLDNDNIPQEIFAKYENRI